jgi:hypothetical protein
MNQANFSGFGSAHGVSISANLLENLFYQHRTSKEGGVMFLPVKLDGLIQDIEIESEDRSFFLNKNTGEVFTVGLEEMAAAQEKLPLEDFPSWQQEIIQKATEILSTEDYFRIPSKFDINEGEIIDRFCRSIADPPLNSELVNHWYEFRGAAFREILVDWCENHGIVYEK